MLIAATSSSSAPVLLNPVVIAQPRIHESVPLAALTQGSSPAVAPSSAGSSETGTSNSTPHSGHVRAHGGGGGRVAASVASEVETLVGGYSVTVGGTQYAGSVQEQNGSYVASVPNVSGATASGDSMIAAENNLTIRIDELV